MILTIAAAAALAGAAQPEASSSAADQPASQLSLQGQLDQARAEIQEQRRLIEAQEARLRALEERLQGQPIASANAVRSAPPAALAQLGPVSRPGDAAATPQAAAPPSVEQVGQRPVDYDRPPEVAVLGSEGSVVTRHGQLTGELQIDYARADRNRAIFRGIEVVESVLVGTFNINESRQDILTESLAVRYGISDKFEVGLRVPFVHRADNSVLVPVQGSTNDPAREVTTAAQGTGIGDLELSARYQLVSAHAGLPYIVGNLQVVAPTGSDPFSVPRNANGEALKAATGSGFWGISPSFTAIVPTDPAVLFGTIGFTHNFGKDVDTEIPPVRIIYVKPGDAISLSAGIGISLNERTSLNLGYAHTWAFGTLTRTVTQNPSTGVWSSPSDTTSRDLQLGRLLFGVTYRATDQASINWSVEVGATEDAPDVRTVLRMPLTLLNPKG